MKLLFIPAIAILFQIVVSYNISNSVHNDLFHISCIERRGKGLRWLEELTDDYGHRKTGSTALEDAIDHVMDSLRSEGFKVHSEPVPGLPNWVRGDDTATVLEPRRHQLSILAIDGSPPGRIQGIVHVIDNFDELEMSNVTGKIVLLVAKWTGYGRTARYRAAASQVANLGAIGVMVSSITPHSLYNVHTGSGARGSPIPAVSVTTEEALMLQRWWKKGKRITVLMDIKSKELFDPVISRNVIFDLPGRTLPHEVIILSAHIDSWDVGQGALDDGGGMAAVLEAIKALQIMAQRYPELAPKRTIRGIYWTAEEQGLLGAKQYFIDHWDQTKERIVFAAETDQGAFRPINLNSAVWFNGTYAQKQKLSGVVDRINNLRIPLSLYNGGGKSDVSFYGEKGVPTATYVSDRGEDFYFRYHHSNADYVNVFDEDDIQYTSAILSIIAQFIAQDENWL